LLAATLLFGFLLRPSAMLCPKATAHSNRMVVAEAIRAYARAGAEHVILNLSSSPMAPSDPAFLDRAAEALALVR